MSKKISKKQETLIKSFTKVLGLIEAAKTLEELKAIMPEIETLLMDPTGAGNIIVRQSWINKKVELRLDALEKAVFNQATPETKNDHPSK